MTVDMSGITELLIYLVIMAAGAIVAVVIPYVLSAWADVNGQKHFSGKHVIILVFGVGVAVIIGMPSSIETINIDTLKQAFFAGMGLTAAITQIVSAIETKGTIAAVRARNETVKIMTEIKGGEATMMVITGFEVGGKMYDIGNLTADIFGQMMREMQPSNVDVIVAKYARYGVKQRGI